MKQVRIPQKQTSTDYIKFFGGLDLETPVLSIKPGNALEAINYEPGVKGGYRRIDGYERFDGRAAPSDATYLFMGVSYSDLVMVNYLLTGATSGATGTVVKVGANDLALSNVTGQFAVGESLKYNGALVGMVGDAPLPRGYRTALEDAQALNGAAAVRRSAITPVPGAGPVRGVWMFKGVVYAFRDNVGATACKMFKATGAGWMEVPLHLEVSLTTSGVQTLQVQEGDTIVGVTSSATAVVRRVMKQSGDWPTSNVKARLILSNIVGGFGVAGESIKIGATTCGAFAAAPAQITLAPGGRYEFKNYNFTGNSLTARMYGCDGKNRAFEFDGAIYAPIATGMTQDTPKFIAAHKKKLWLTYMGSLQNSGDGLPYSWTVVTGANEMGIGDDIVGMAIQPGDTLAVFSRNSTWQVNGTTTNSFQLLPISPDVGAIPYTVQSLGRTYAMDDRGVVETTRVQAYGNFDQATVSSEIQPMVDLLRERVIGSTTYNSRNQYRVYCDDGSGFVMTVAGEKIVGFTQLRYPVAMSCVTSCEDATGKSVVFMGGATGYVYQADRGSSFDGEDIEAYLRMPFASLSSPRYRKQYKKAVLEMTAVSYASIRFQPDFSYGDPDVSTHRLQTGEVGGAGGTLDVSNWGNFFYDAKLVSNPEFGIEGTGLNMSLLFYSKSSIDCGHTLQGMIIHYFTGRLAR